MIYADKSWAITNVSLTRTTILAVASDLAGNASTHTIRVRLGGSQSPQCDLKGNLPGRGETAGSGASAGSLGVRTSLLAAYTPRACSNARKRCDEAGLLESRWHAAWWVRGTASLAVRASPVVQIRGASASLPTVWSRPSSGRRTFSYDSENQLIQVVVSNGPASSTKSDFVYDARGRRRIRFEAYWQGVDWATNEIVRYVYDGNLVVQERNGSNNVPLVAYTRGLDLSGTLEGAGGIGGLLTRTDRDEGLLFCRHDANGNVTALVAKDYGMGPLSQALYRYDPFGNPIAQSGGFADLNLYRFSSKEFHPPSGLYYCGKRYYDPGLQRWINRDPIVLSGGVNLFSFAGNMGVNAVDPWGDITVSTDRLIALKQNVYYINPGSLSILSWYRPGDVTYIGKMVNGVMGDDGTWGMGDVYVVADKWKRWTDSPDTLLTEEERQRIECANSLYSMAHLGPLLPRDHWFEVLMWGHPTNTALYGMPPVGGIRPSPVARPLPRASTVPSASVFEIETRGGMLTRDGRVLQRGTVKCRRDFVEGRETTRVDLDHSRGELGPPHVIDVHVNPNNPNQNKLVGTTAADAR